MKNSLPLTRVTTETRESVELQSHKWKDNSVNRCPNSLPNSPRKCNPDLLSEAHCLWDRGTDASDGPGQQSCCEHPAALPPLSCKAGHEQGLLYTQPAGTQGLETSSAAEVYVLENINQLIHFPSYHNLKLHWSGHFIQTI